ncbi:aspartyl protease family protein [Rasiella sp. SM2506]|uniref:retropepsin-like aspartic protease n=1 Tax=Rasiella sp. SM2506 TaxID=3423914 RepID=UPI003D7B2E4E
MQTFLVYRFLLQIILLLLGSQIMIAQEGFVLPKGVKSDKIKFELVNNLVIVPVELNGTKLSFLLDTGVNTTLVFSISENDSLSLNNAIPTKIRGLGAGESIDALESKNNTLRVGKALDMTHSLYVVFDESLNFSSRMGVPIHGILGYDFFKNFVVKTDYIAKKLTIYNPELSKRQPWRRYEEFDLEFYANKPFVSVKVSGENGFQNIPLLIDSGSSDGLWLFREKKYISETPKNYFDDFLGLGLSGNIFGKRSKIDEVVIGDYSLKNVSTSFPDKDALQNIVFFKHRHGSLGAAILKRFMVWIDYENEKMYLKKNANFSKPFYYNMAGITLQHEGTVTVRDVQDFRTGSLNLSQSDRNNGSVTIPVSPAYSFFLAPRIVIAELRVGSPGAQAGFLKGDEVVSVNNKLAYKYKLYELSALFSSKANRTIYMVVERDGKQIKNKFKLRKML